VVKRTEQQHGVDRCVRQVPVASIADFGVHHGFARALKLLYMQTHEVSMLDRVAQLSQPQRIPPRPTSDIGDYRRWGRKPPLQNLLRALELDYAVRIIQPVPLPALRVVRPQLSILRAHGVSLSDNEENRERLSLKAAKEPQAGPSTSTSVAVQPTCW
jgi:hypothetical protein